MSKINGRESLFGPGGPRSQRQNVTEVMKSFTFNYSINRCNSMSKSHIKRNPFLNIFDLIQSKVYWTFNLRNQLFDWKGLVNSI